MTSEKKFDLELHRRARKTLTWGTLGPQGNFKTHKMVKIADLSTPHIVAIRLTQHHINDTLKQHFANEIHYRELFPEANIDD